MGSGDAVEDRWEEVFLLAGYAIHPLLFVSLLLWPWAVLYMDRTVFFVLQGFMALGIAAAALSLLVTIRERDDRWLVASLFEVVAGLCVGVGMMVNNTVGQLQGFLASGGEFARTPKRSRTASGLATAVSGSDRPYASPLHWTFFAEVLIIGYCLMTAVFLVRQGEGLWAVAMVFWAACLGLVVQQQMTRHNA
jgi:hypothetical protein